MCGGEAEKCFSLHSKRVCLFASSLAWLPIDELDMVMMLKTVFSVRYGLLWLPLRFILANAKSIFGVWHDTRPLPPSSLPSTFSLPAFQYHVTPSWQNPSPAPTPHLPRKFSAYPSDVFIPNPCASHPPFIVCFSPLIRSPSVYYPNHIRIWCEYGGSFGYIHRLRLNNFPNKFGIVQGLHYLCKVQN